jgi:inorganic pyrophosphatase
VVESPRGSGVKLKYDPRWNAMSVSRPLVLGVTYPFDWGFVPSTLGADGDPLDALVLWDVASYPGVVLPCRALGVMYIEQNRVNHDPSERIRNDRILAIPEAAGRERDFTTVDALPSRVRAELEELIAIATALEGKDVRVTGWGDAAAALKLIADADTGNAS